MLKLIWISLGIESQLFYTEILIKSLMNTESCNTLYSVPRLYRFQVMLCITEWESVEVAQSSCCCVSWRSDISSPSFLLIFTTRPDWANVSRWPTKHCSSHAKKISHLLLLKTTFCVIMCRQIWLETSAQFLCHFSTPDMCIFWTLAGEFWAYK